jgi:hypothetical protein
MKQFNIIALIKQYLPNILRKPKHIAWLSALLLPLQDLIDGLFIFVQLQQNEALKTPQVGSIENILNKQFDPALRRIYISENTKKVFTKSNKRYFIRSNRKPLIMYSLQDHNLSYDFTIHIPTFENRFFFKSNIRSYKHPYVLLKQQSVNSANNNIALMASKYKFSGVIFNIQNI